MKHFIQLGNVDVLPLLLQLDRNPQLWDANDTRTSHVGSPHSDVSDIWLRWRKAEELTSPASYNEPFINFQWYDAMNLLPAVRPILMDIMARVGGTALGGALITKIPSGKAVKPHSDSASWHANFFNLKVYTVIKSNPNAVNWCAGESLVMAPGTVWSFDNTKPHSVYNEGDDDRITMMVAVRTE